ncbi:amidohydrolase family protein [Sphingopyxis sp. 2PD]|uniref:amidohydrolase family protein n=1 Tax=Sphingopyxis sp. 2PD TaxID=2502196 RepID=UPI0010F77B70|nr:amidohydrolase family protein [Sphingopyxis sp. 2PD]
MKRFLLGFGAFVTIAAIILTAMISIPLAKTPNVGLSQDIIIKDVAIIDVQNGGIIPNQDVIIQDGRLASIDRTSGQTPATSLHVVDGRGKYLAPSLWDMHTHSFKTSPQFHHPLLIANGVLGVRDMSGCLSEDDSFWACIEDRQAWNRATETKTGLSPRYFLQSSYQTNGGNEVPDGFPSFFKVNHLSGIEQFVSFYKKAGADFIKTYSELSPEAYKALAKQAEVQGLKIAGHQPLRVSLRETIAAKQQTIEHPRLFLIECYKGREQFLALADPLRAYTTEFKARLVDEHDGVRCQQMFQEMARSDTFWTPTLQVLQLGAKAGERSFRENPRLRYIPTIIRSGIWQGDADQLAKRAVTPQGRNVDIELYALAMTNVAQAHDARVKILVGTDSGDSYIFPGFAVHEEMAELVKAGISPQDVLRMATIDAAAFSGADRKFGSIEEGKAADMMLLAANPYDDIRNTQKITAIFYNGQFFDRAALDGLLDFAEQQAGSIRLNIRLLWDALSSPLMRVQLVD